MQIRSRTIERLRDALLSSGKREGPVVTSAYSTLVNQGLLGDKEQAALDRVDAVAETMFLVMAADEQIMETEMAGLRGAIRGLTGEVLNDGIIDVMVANYAGRLRDQGCEARLESVAHAMSDVHEAESAFSLAAAIALADDDVDPAESEVLQALARWLGFDDAKVESVLGVLADDARD